MTNNSGETLRSGATEDEWQVVIAFQADNVPLDWRVRSDSSELYLDFVDERAAYLWCDYLNSLSSSSAILAELCKSALDAINQGRATDGCTGLL